MVSVRTITIGGVKYLQTVNYMKTLDGKTKIDVIKSFGRDTIQNRMEAERFATSYNKLKEIVSQVRDQNDTNTNDLINTAVTIFGFILGAAIIGAIINEIFGDN